MICQPIPLPADRVPLHIPAKQEGVAEALIQRNLNVRRVQPSLSTAVSDRRKIVARNASGTGADRTFRRQKANASMPAPSLGHRRPPFVRQRNFDGHRRNPIHLPLTPKDSTSAGNAAETIRTTVKGDLV